MSLVCFDTNFVLWGVIKKATPGQEENIDRACHVISQCSKDGKRIVIPAIVLGELLCGLLEEKHGQFIQAIEKSFVVTPYDSRAATHYARMWKTRSEINRLSFTRGELKADFMIAAVAVAHKCECIYSNDRGLANFSKPFIPVISINDIVLPASQPPLPNMR